MERSVSMLKNFLFGSSNTKTEYVVWKFPGLLVVAVQNIAELPDFSSYPLPFTWNMNTSKDCKEPMKVQNSGSQCQTVEGTCWALKSMMGGNLAGIFGRNNPEGYMDHWASGSMV